MIEYILTPATNRDGNHVIMLHRVRDQAPNWNGRWRWIGTWDARDEQTAVAVRDDLNRMEDRHVV